MVLSEMHDAESFPVYKDFIKSERPVPNQVNCGYFNPRKVKTPTVGFRNKHETR